MCFLSSNTPRNKTDEFYTNNKQAEEVVSTKFSSFSFEIEAIKSQLASCHRDNAQANNDAIRKISSLESDIGALKIALQKDKEQYNKDIFKQKKLNFAFSTDIDAIKAQFVKSLQENKKTKEENIFICETNNYYKYLKDFNSKYEAKYEFFKSQLKRLHDMNGKFNEESNVGLKANLSKHVATITKDICTTPSTIDTVRFFAQLIASASCENKKQLLKLQFNDATKIDEKTMREVSEMNSFVVLANENNLTADKYSRLENMLLKLSENSAIRGYIKESVQQQLTTETGELSKLVTRLEQLETRNNEMQCFVDELASVSDPILKQNYELQKTLVETMQAENAMHKKMLQEYVSQLDEDLKEKIIQLVSITVDK